jgi:hypothetical protein
MTDREGLFSKGRNPNSLQPVARPLTFKYNFCQAGKRKKDPRGPLPLFQNAKVLPKNKELRDLSSASLSLTVDI